MMIKGSFFKSAQQLLTPIALSLAFVGFTTAILFVVEARIELDAIIFIYFFPTTFLAIQYGNCTATIAIITSDLAAAFFLYSPKFSLKVANPLDVVEIMFFTMLALMATKVVSGFAKDPTVQGKASGAKRFLG